jgi:homoserine O-acetyltransferase
VLLWQAENEAIRNDPAWNGGNYEAQPARGALFEFSELMLSTPERYNHITKREDVLPSIARARTAPVFDANDHIRQSEAMIAHDVSAAFGGAMEKAAAAVRAKVLVIVSATDHMVTPGPAVEFARLLGAELIELQTDCGHLATNCEAGSLAASVNAFLSK